MREILFIKTSSLGDVVHHMPAVTDARRAWPNARISWMVEENYAPLVRLHPAVDDVIPVAVRYWRGRLLRSGTWGEIRRFAWGARARRFDAIVDTQGLIRSALLSRFVRGTRHGYDRHSIRERAASAFYDVRHAVDRSLHAINRNRALSGLALGYVPEKTVDFGLARDRLPASASSYAVLLHGSAQTAKEWPEPNWIALGKVLNDSGVAAVLPAGTAAERNRGLRIAEALEEASVPEPQPLDDIARLIAGATLVVGLDTGLTHLAAAFGVPVVAIFTGSDPILTGPRGSGPVATVGDRGHGPSQYDVIEAARAMLGSVRSLPAPP